MPADKKTCDELWSVVEELKLQKKAAEDTDSPVLGEIKLALVEAVAAYKKAAFASAAATIAALDTAHGDLERFRKGTA